MLDAIKTHLKMSKNTDFANYLGISSQSLSNWYSRNTFDAELIYTKCVFVNAAWLLSGDGSMLRKNTIEPKPCAPVVSAIDNGMVDKLFNKLDEKDKIIVQQSEEIGKLRSQLDACQDKLYDSTFTEPCISDSSGHKKSAVGSADAPSLRK